MKYCILCLIVFMTYGYSEPQNIGAPPPKAKLFAPSGSIQATNPVFRWNDVSSATWYQIWVKQANGQVFNKWYHRNSINCINAGECQNTFPIDISLGTYQWWVRSWNSAGHSVWSNTKSFNITNTSVPAAPTLNSPSGNILSSKPLMVWTDVAEAQWYYLWINMANGDVFKQWFQRDTIDCINGTECKAVLPISLPAGSHQWWVRGWNQTGNGAWSNAKTFVIANTQNPKIQIDLGYGIIKPYAVAPLPGNPSKLAIINGQGEDSGSGFLYKLNTLTMQHEGTPLNVGVNPSDIATIGNNIVVTARGSNQIFLIDAVSWRVIDTIDSGDRPISIDAFKNNRFIVANYSGSISVYRIIAGKISAMATMTLPHILYNVAVDPEGKHAYVSLPLSGEVYELRLSDLSVSRIFSTGGVPSFGMVVTEKHVVVTDRDGYLININRASGNSTSLDLAPLLNLDRATLPTRGIEPFHLSEINGKKLLIINNRANSLILPLRENSGPVPQLLQELSGGSSGIYRSTQNDFFITKPSANVIDKFTYSNGDTVLTKASFIVGSSIEQSARVQGKIGIINSQSEMIFIDEITKQGTALNKVVMPGAWNKITSNNLDRFYAINWQVGGYALTEFDNMGGVLNSIAITTLNPSQLKVTGSTASIVDRLNGTVELIDLITMTTLQFSTIQERPREMVIFSDNSWLVIHDTHPNVGISHGVSNQIDGFVPHTTNGNWLSSIVAYDEQYAVIGGFGANTSGVTLFDRQTKTPTLTKALPIKGISHLVKSDNSGIWVISQSDGSISHLSPLDLRLEYSINIPDIKYLLTAPELNGFWAVTNKSLYLY